MSGAQGNALVPLVLLGWVPLVIWLFAKIEPVKAAAIAFVAAWMFLPVAKIPLKGLPDYTKVTATCTGIFLAAWIYDRKRILDFQIALIDVPMVLWCVCPFLSSVCNGLGAYDGVSETMYQSFKWGLPYFVGRVYFTQLKGINILGVTVFLGGLLYIPFCLEEMAMSPQLHRLLYGFHQHSFAQTMRGGGYRPMVFMEHGLMVAMWMISASMIGLWLAYSKLLPDLFMELPLGQQIKKIPLPLLLFVLLLTMVLMKSTGAFALFDIGLASLYLSNKLKTTLIIWFLLCLPPVYMLARSTGWWTGERLTEAISEKFSEERGQSLQFRFDNEKILVEKALSGPFVGWGGWSRSRVFDEDGKDLTVTDGLWIITLGTRGIYGLVLLTFVVLLPVLLLLFRSHPEQWNSKEYGAIAVMSVLLVLYMIDNLLNGMVNPVFMLFDGGICGLLAQDIPASLDEKEGRPLLIPWPTRYLSAPSAGFRVKYIK